MHELANILAINLGVVAIIIIAYLWGLATKEVRYENKIKQIQAQQQRSLSPALRRYYESR